MQKDNFTREIAEDWVNELADDGYFPAQYATRRPRQDITEQQKIYPQDLYGGSWQQQNNGQYKIAPETYVQPFLNDEELYDNQLQDLSGGNDTHYKMLKRKTKDWEEYREYVYLDSADNKTVGWGTNIQNDKKRSGVRWLNNVPLEESERQMKLIDAKAGKNWSADHFKKLDNVNIRISPKEADRLYNLDYSEAEKTAAKYIPNFRKLPYFVREVIVDEPYNLGETRFKKFQKFHNAINNNNFYEAAQESHRLGIGEDRNRWAYERLLAYERFLSAQRKQETLRKMMRGVDVPINWKQKSEWEA